MIIVNATIALERAISGGAIDMDATLILKRGSSTIAVESPAVAFPTAATGNVNASLPAGFCYLDVQAAGTYTYKLQLQADPLDTLTTATVTAGLGVNAITVYEL